MRPLPSILAFFLACLHAPNAAWAQAPQPDRRVPNPQIAAPGELLQIPVSRAKGRGNLALRVHTPDAFESVVATDDPNAATFRTRARIIVRAANQAPIDGLAIARGNPGRSRAADPTGRSGRALRDFWIIDAPTVRQGAALAASLRDQPGVTEAYIDTAPFVPRSPPTDPFFTSQWYLNNTATPAASINVLPVWMSGFTGAGVVVGIIDQGFNTGHPDLAANFNLAGSQANFGFSDHGTSVAGLVAMVANNAKGGAGVAYGAQVSRLYFGFQSDNAVAFAHENQINAIKNNSWGPYTPGVIFPMSSIELAALEGAVVTGRAGKGTVFFWAAAEAGIINNDRIDYDGYSSNRFSICISSIDNIDRAAAYAEVGSSHMLVTTSSFDFSGSGGSGVFAPAGSSTTGDGTYTTGFGGTSGASPIAAGVAALMLQARPALSWRDVQHVLIRSARKVNPADAGWTTNGAGRNIHYKFGLGAIDAAAAVSLAQTFPFRGAEQIFASPLTSVSQPIPDNNATGISATIPVGANLTVERVQVVINAPHPRIGDLRVTLTSPSGTTSLLADVRFDTTPGYTDHVYTSVRHWDELAHGLWSLTIADAAAGNTGSFGSWQLKIYGASPDCPPNWNGGALGVSDIFSFLTDWFAGRADFNNDGASTVADIFAFLTAWFAGC